nr:hypothetical protein HUO10_000392 [Paraburkholderia busanensis]
MHVTQISTRLFASVTLTAMLAGCATEGGPSPLANISCNPAIAAVAGGVLGAVVTGGNKVAGAAIGAGVAALLCAAVDYEAKQIKTAQQAQADYRSAHNGRLPDQASLVKYTTSFTPSSISAGDKATLNSYIEVVKGRQDATDPVIEEEATIYKPDGSVAKSVRKPVAKTASAGAFSSSFTIPMPQGVPQGAYPVKSTLYVNGTEVAERKVALQVVASASTGTTYALLEPASPSRPGSTSSMP